MDITERKEAEQRLKQQEGTPASGGSRTTTDRCFRPNRERLYLNRMSLDYFGMTLAQWREHRQRKVHPDDTERLRSQWSSAAPSGSAFEIEFRLRRNDGVIVGSHRHNPVRDD